MSNPNDSAFPVMYRTTERDDGTGTNIESIAGLTKREYFAGLAMQGLMAAADYWDGYNDDSHATPQWFAVAAVQQADALLAALESTP